MFAADIVQNIRGGIEEGIFRQGHPEIWAQALVGMCIQSVSWWVENDHVSAADVAGQIAALAQHGMINVHS
jgi:hypothetical protein